MTQDIEAVPNGLDELWRELVRMSRSDPMTLRKADYRDGLFSAYCIVTGLYGNEVYDLLQRELGE